MKEAICVLEYIENENDTQVILVDMSATTSTYKLAIERAQRYPGKHTTIPEEESHLYGKDHGIVTDSITLYVK